MGDLIVSLWVTDKHFRYDLGDLDQEIYVAS
jgi:hypothetical protein